MWIQTYSGGIFYPLSPRKEDVFLEDIAHALSLMCRFGGHCKEFYSVAQHSVILSRQVPEEDALQGLLHDASEAYFADICRPVKNGLVGIKSIETLLQDTIMEKFHLPLELSKEVKEADTRMLATEHRDLMIKGPNWNSLRDIEPYLFGIIPVDWKRANVMFLERYYEIMKGEK